MKLMRLASSSSRPRLVGPLGDVGIEVGDDEADRHVARDDLPRRPRGEERLLQPPELLGAEEGGLLVQYRLAVRRVRPPIAPLVDHEDVE